MGLQDVVDLSSASDTALEELLGRALPESATILGDDSDQVTLENGPEGNWQQSDTVTDNEGTTFNVYEFADSSSDVLATLAIDDEVTVIAPVN